MVNSQKSKDTRKLAIEYYKDHCGTSQIFIEISERISKIFRIKVQNVRGFFTNNNIGQKAYIF